MGAPSTLFPITDNHAMAIGRVTANWALVEAQLTHLIMYLLGLQAYPSHAVTAELQIIQRIALAETLVGITGNPKWINEWNTIWTEMNDLRQKRNDVVHAEWRYAGLQDEHESIRVKAKGRVSINLRLESTTKVLALAKRIASLEEHLGRYAYALTVGEAHKIIASPDPPGPPPIQARKKNAPVPARDLSHLSKTEVKWIRRLRAEMEEKRRSRQKS